MSSLLLQLKPENALVHEHIVNTLSLPVEERGSMDVRLGDFDGYYWRVEVVEGSATHVYVCLECPCYAQLQRLVWGPFRSPWWFHPGYLLPLFSFLKSPPPNSHKTITPPLPLQLCRKKKKPFTTAWDWMLI